jgi:hypothetical protein
LNSVSIFNRGILLSIGLLPLTIAPLCAEQKNSCDAPNCSSRTQTSNQWKISADFLAWFASEEVTSIWADVITLGDNSSTWTAPSFNFKWDYGFRLGIGHDLTHDQWDTTLNWTWFRTSAAHAIPIQASTHLGPEFDAGFLSMDVPTHMNAKWSLLLNMFDWQIGRSFWISKSISMRPYSGLKGGWINQSIHANYFDLTIDHHLTDLSGSENLKNNFWGIGPTGGVNTKWTIRNFKSHSFSFFGDFSVATMWGTWNCSDVYKNTAPKTVSVNTKRSTLGALTFQGLMGIGWDADFNRGRTHFSTKLGYEMQIWFNQLQIATFQLQRLHGDLTFQGVTLNCQFSF